MREAGKFFVIVVGLLVLCMGYIESQGGSPFKLASLSAQSPAAGASVVGSPTVSSQFADQLLCKYNSPACGTGQDLYNLGVQYNVDPAFALAVFFNESGFGKAGMAASTRSLGNLRCIPSAACWNGYADYSSWQDGYKSFYALISGPLYVGSGLSTPEAIIPRYAPSGDGNSPSHYISVVDSAMSLWRAGKVEVP